MICVKCGKDKSETDYSWKDREAKKHHNECKKCHNNYYSRKWYAKNRELQIRLVADRKRRYKETTRAYLYEYFKTHPCMDCGISDPVVLELDHIDRKNKKAAVGKLLSDGHSPQMIMRELKKCVVRCANCHRRKTSREQDWYKAL